MLFEWINSRNMDTGNGLHRDSNIENCDFVRVMSDGEDDRIIDSVTGLI